MDYANINSLIEEILNEYLNGATDSNIINQKIRLERKNRSRLKKRWVASLKDSYKTTDPMDESNPFYMNGLTYSALNGTQRKMLYGNKSLEEVYDALYMEAENWAADQDKYLVEYPAFSSLKSNKAIKSLKSDIFINIGYIIKNRFDGDLSDYLQIYPSSLVEKPLFGTKSQELALEVTQAGTFMEKLIFSDEYEFQTVYDPKDNTKLKTIRSFDETDRKIIQKILTCISQPFYNTRVISLKLRTIAAVINNAASQYYRNKAVERINMYPSFVYNVVTTSDTGVVKSDTFNIFSRVQIIDDNSIINEDGTIEYSADADVDITVGDALYDELIKKQVTAITTKSLASLDDTLARIMSVALQKERTALYYSHLGAANPDTLPKIPVPISDSDIENLHDSKKLFSMLSKQASDQEHAGLHGIYDYTWFQRIARMPSRKKMDNIKAISAALTDMKQKHFIIQNFSQKNTSFDITFFDLTEAELLDLENFDINNGI